MLLFWIASAGFFLFCVRQILQWVYLWQKADYSFQDFIHLLFNTFQNEKEHIFVLILYVSLLIFYGTTIFIDGLTLIFQIFVTFFFLFGGVLFVFDIKQIKLKRPFFTIFPSSLIFLTLFTLSIFFMLPLIDTFAWLLFLMLLVPVIITFLVGLFSFPREIYTDFILQKARKIIEDQQIKTIIFIGESNKNISERAINKIISIETNELVISNISSTLQLAKEIVYKTNKKTKIIFIHTKLVNKSSCKKIVSLLQPRGVIYLSLSEDDLFIKDKKHFLNTQKHFLNFFPKDTIILINGEDPTLFRLSQVTERVSFLYGSHENIHKNELFLQTKVMNIAKGITTFQTTFGKKKFIYKTHMLYKNISDIIPALFLAKVWGYSEKEIEKNVYAFGRKKNYLTRKR